MTTMNELTENLLHVDAGSWHASPSDHGTVTWLPLTRISDSGLWLGLDRDGSWVLGRLRDRVASASASAKPSPGWLTILDMGEREFREKLSTASSSFGL